MRVFEEAKAIKNKNSSSPIYLFKFPPEAIKEVLLGCRMSRMNKDKILDNIYKLPCYKKIQVKQAIEDENKFKLKFKKKDLKCLYVDDEQAQNYMEAMKVKIGDYIDKMNIEELATSLLNDALSKN